MTPPQTAPGRQRALWPAVTLAGSGLAAAGALLLAGGAAAGDPPDLLGEKTGGDTTVYATGRNAFSFLQPTWKTRNARAS